MQTNDDDDDGLPDANVVNLELTWPNAEAALKQTGVCRTGVYGHVVAVVLDGEEVRALASAPPERPPLVERMRDALVELTEGEGCDHNVGICWCSVYALLDEAAVELGEARWCACDRDREGICDRCYGLGIVGPEE